MKKCPPKNPKVQKANALIEEGSHILDRKGVRRSDVASANLTKANKLLYEAGCIKKGTLKK